MPCFDAASDNNYGYLFDSRGWLTKWWLYDVKISGLFLPAVVRPILDSYEASKQVPQPVLSDVSV